MPQHYNHDQKLHSHVHLAMALLYALGCIGYGETVVGAGLAICYYLLYRF